jgi:hypothetical protein
VCSSKRDLLALVPALKPVLHALVAGVSASHPVWFAKHSRCGRWRRTSECDTDGSLVIDVRRDFGRPQSHSSSSRQP